MVNNLKDNEELVIGSILDISGKDENAITKSFGVILKKDMFLLKEVINKVIRRKVKMTKSIFTNTKFTFEKHLPHGRVDIEIYNKQFHILIESKIGNNQVGFDQATKYAKDLTKSKPKLKLFILLTEIKNLDIIKRLQQTYPSINFYNMFWGETLDLVRNRKKIMIDLVKEYESYLREGRKMRIHDMDIWAVVITKKKEIRNYRKGVYCNLQYHTPLLLGLRKMDKKLNKSVIKEIRPIMKVSPNQHSSTGGYIYKLGPIVKLETPILNEREKFSQSSAQKLDFDKIRVK